ncbi:MAG: tRNA uridine-5-carboxymethylaminomethyl(34) synthesis GTPase MnmE [Legionellaceae bacterium]|nr:tRNA uridine-5-carboxymethylaminomethyl(34) synthesis GTPase MnmE [Legionellaceae bacterium]
MQPYKSDTIVACATPPGRGGVGIIRLSGSLAYSIVLKINQQQTLIPRYAKYGSVYNQYGECLDTGLFLYFQAPHSFTGEDVVEIQVHGSPVVIDAIIEETLRLGARIARPGEFSERAFIFGKMDLVQAEAVADLIHAHSQKAARLAVRSLQGEFSKKITLIHDKIIYLRMFIEASLDFSEEAIEHIEKEKIDHQLQEISAQIEQVLLNAYQGSLLQEGISVVIAGKPNAGKSSILNALAGYDVAIVTAIPGTTRDVMRESIMIDDIPLHIIDTAGIRESTDIIEQEGIRRARHAITNADCVLWIKDIQDLKNDSVEEVLEAIPEGIPILEVINKIDTKNQVAHRTNDIIYMSALTGEGLSLLKTALKEKVGYEPTEGLFLARRRHVDALKRTQEHLYLAHETFRTSSFELLAENLRLAHQYLGEITGEFTSDDLLGVIFSQFCIGK